MKTLKWQPVLLLTIGVSACTPESDEDLGLEVDAQDIENAAEEAADEVTEENADELLDELEAQINQDG